MESAKKMMKKSLIGNEPKKPTPDSPEKLEGMIVAYSRFGEFSVSNKERLTKLMKRRSAKNWSPAKKAQMTRRYMEATTGTDQSSQVIDQLKHRLSSLTTDSAPAGT